MIEEGRRGDGLRRIVSSIHWGGELHSAELVQHSAGVARHLEEGMLREVWTSEIEKDEKPENLQSFTK